MAKTGPCRNQRCLFSTITLIPKIFKPTFPINLPYRVALLGWNGRSRQRKIPIKEDVPINMIIKKYLIIFNMIKGSWPNVIRQACDPMS
jgi:hypothetical protein